MFKTKHPLYGTWTLMLERCYNPKNIGFHNYGGRGITVCDRWKDSFWHFVEDMPPRPSGHTLERKDTNGHYTPDNCTWATPKEQSRNMRTARIVTFKGKKIHVSELSEQTGINPRTLYWRISQGWTPKQVLSKEPLWNNTESQKKAVAAHAAKKRSQTHCKRGHSLEGKNLYIHRGRRHCRICRRMHDQGKL